MNYLCILNERNSIEINFIIHSKFDIIPILLCSKSIGLLCTRETNITLTPNQYHIRTGEEKEIDNIRKLSRIGIIIQSLTSDRRQCCTLSSNIQMSPWSELSSVNNFTFDRIRSFGLNQERHHTTCIIHQESEIHIRLHTITSMHQHQRPGIDSSWDK
jgi:hypothetical protein